MKLGFLDYMYLGAEHWRNQPHFFVSLFFRLFGPLGTNTRIRVGRTLLAVPDWDFNNRRVLDVGCGLGYGLFWLARNFPNGHFEGIELDRERVRMNKRVAKAAGLPVQFHHESLENLSKEPGYDLIFNADVLEHVEDDVGMIEQMAWRLRPGGRIIIHVPYRHQLQRRIIPVFAKHIIDDHVRDEYTEEEIVSKINNAGLQVVKIGYGFGLLGEVSFELNNMFWEQPTLRNISALLTFPAALLMGYLDLKQELNRGNSILIVAS